MSGNLNPGNSTITSTHNHPALGGIKPIRLGLITNLVLTVAKAVAGIYGNSQALVADAVESGGDVVSSLVVWVGLKASSIRPDSNHPYGHGKAEPFAGFLVSLFLLGAAILIAISSVKFILAPHESPASYTLIVLILTIVIKEMLYRYVIRKGTKLESTSIKADAWHHRSDAITSLVAGVGITISLIGGAGYESADDWAALGGSLIIGINSARILNHSFNEIMDAAPSAELINEIKNIAASVEKVRGVEKCRVRKMGLEYFVDMHVEVDRNLTVEEGHAIAHDVKRKIRSTKPNVHDVLVHVEPFK